MNTESKAALPWESEFATKIRKRREARGLSQTAMAKLAAESGLPFHQQTIQRIEDGKRPVRLNEAIVLATISGATLEELTTPDSPGGTSQKLAMDVDGLVSRVSDFVYQISQAFNDINIALSTAKVGRQLYVQACEALGQEIDEASLVTIDAVLTEAAAALDRLRSFRDEWDQSVSSGATAIGAWEESASDQTRIHLWPEGETNG